MKLAAEKNLNKYAIPVINLKGKQITYPVNIPCHFQYTGAETLYIQFENVVDILQYIVQETRKYAFSL